MYFIYFNGLAILWYEKPKNLSSYFVVWDQGSFIRPNKKNLDAIEIGRTMFAYLFPLSDEEISSTQYFFNH